MASVGPISGIKKNKCFENVVTLRSTWIFDVPAIGETTTKSFNIRDLGDISAGAITNVIVTPADISPTSGTSVTYDPSKLIVYGYFDGLHTVTIGVKNVSESSIDDITVNFIII